MKRHLTQTFGRLAACLGALIAAAPAQGELTPEWTISHASTWFTGTYYDNPDFTKPVATRQDALIAFEWGADTPMGGMGADTFSVRWEGGITPLYSEQYTFHAYTDDGFRMWLDGELIIDAWFDQFPTWHNSEPIQLAAGKTYPVKIEYYENSGTAVARLQWSSASQALAHVMTRGDVDFFGTTRASVGNGRFAVGAPGYDIQLGPSSRNFEAGALWFGNVAGELAWPLSEPSPDARGRKEYASALSAFPDGRLLVGAPGVTQGINPAYPGAGKVHLFNAAGQWEAEWENPTTGPAAENTAFGRTVGALQGNLFAASALIPPGNASTGVVHLFNAKSVGAPVATFTNTARTLTSFGSAIAPLGEDRILIGDSGNPHLATPTARVLIGDHTGRVLRTIQDPAERSREEFGRAILPLDDRRFLVGAPGADISYVANGQLVTNRNAGKVYLFDDTGALLKTFSPPDPANSTRFGYALARLGADRVVIGAPESLEDVGPMHGGSVHVFTLDGLRLETIANPTPKWGEDFGSALAVVDDHLLIVGARADSTHRPSAGSIYAFNLPAPTVELGAEIPRPDGIDVSGNFPAQGPTVTPAGAAYWHAPSQKLYAVKPGKVLVTWPLLNNRVHNWQGGVGWPQDESLYQTHIASPAAVDLTGGGAFTHARLLATTTDADEERVSDDRQFMATAPGRSLLLLASGDPATQPIRFQFVRSIAWNDPEHLHDNAPAIIGEPVVDPANYQDPAAGSPQVALPNSIYCPAPVFDRATRAGTIIPVNRDNPNDPDDDLVVTYYQRGQRLRDPATGATVPNAIEWPYQAVRFNPQWPTSAPRLIIASGEGTGVLNPAQYPDWELYFQNDPDQPGFNPNDEHALIRPIGAGEAVFALRDDLGTPATSEPYVLIRYRDPAAAGQWRMKVWKVVAEEAPHFFEYPATAGLLIQAPFPIDTLAPAPESAGVSGPWWRDRKLSFWARAAGDDGGTADIVLRFFYPLQPGFFMPGPNPPAVGANIPFLDLRAGTPGTPIDIHYLTRWPDEVPELRAGETLVKPKNGLPQIAGQSSVEVIYEQSIANDEGHSVLLIDPVVARSVPLAQLPPGVATTLRSGLQHFPALPPHLENRVRYDPANRRLQLVGEFVEPPAGEACLLLNVLTPRDRAQLAALSADAAWQSAVSALANEASEVVTVPPDATGFDSLALTAGASYGIGYVTLAFGNSPHLAAPSDPVSLSVIRVACPPYRGEIKVIESPNPLAEQLTLRHSGDFAGQPDEFEFEWRSLPPVDGLPSPLPPNQWVAFQTTPPHGAGAVDITLSGPGLHTLSDHYFICRYRRRSADGAPCGTTWSEWTAPMLAEGWIKRVLAGIGPFEQRIKDYQDTQVNTIVSMLSQAGARAVGDVALNLNAVNEAGLIEVYETVLRRGMALSINGAPPVDFPPANDALLLAAGRLADLYMLLGNEAYADAADPTIAFGTEDGIYGSQATSLHCFMNQTASLLEEELALLRGRDASRLPSVQTHPVYNRLIWNFTRDITGGEVAYALNYNLRNANGDVAGTIDEGDAKLLYPQGHGDAWGHYLTAIKNYYRLLRSPHFTWVPRIEAVIVGGVPVSVDYMDERKFAAAAAARARAGAEIASLTFRDSYTETPSRPWQTRPDTNPERAWGLADWSVRAGQGALFDWVVANALLPHVDPNPNHTGIQKIERANIRELHEIASAFREIQEEMDKADQGRNPLGLASNVVPFDIDPGAIAAGKTHFEQVNERAIEALRNAVAVFDHANASTQLLRRQADDANAFEQRVADGEADFNNRLIKIFGTPYSDDIGPGRTYPSNYRGPDIYHYDYVDDPEIAGNANAQQPTLTFSLSEISVLPSGGLQSVTRPVTFHFSPNGFGLRKPASWTGQRSAPGEIQLARGALTEALRRLERGVTEYENLINQIEDAAESLLAERNLSASQLRIRQSQHNLTVQLNEFLSDQRDDILVLRAAAEAARITTDFAADALPHVLGLASDALSVQRATIKAIGRGMLIAPAEAEIALREKEMLDRQDSKNQAASLAELELFSLQAAQADKERLRQLEHLVRSEPAARLELAALAESQKQALARYEAAVARGLRLLEERTRFRQQTAAQIQSYRHKDMAFRLFRTDALQKYRAQFDLAARYACLAAKAYDYETCLAPGDPRGPGSAFLTSIIRSRALGLFVNGVPLPRGDNGDPGLADPLARMSANWSLVLKGQLGFNNPQTETGRFSLRNELFRILSGPGGSQRWRETLESHVVPNVLALPEFQRHCIPFSPAEPVEPAIVIPFGTTINFGLNFFGWPAGGGDNDYDSTKFATKVRSVGVWFANYNNLGAGMINTPRVYLVPVGLDVMRAPTQGQPHVREWRILDQALPVPFPLSTSDLNDPNWIPIQDSLSESFAAIRRVGRFRAYHDSGNFNPAETIQDSRLIGRSVWNTRWLLIIPAGSLHTDRNEGIQRFIHGALRADGTRDGNGVTDIKVFFQTYAYSGN